VHPVYNKGGKFATGINETGGIFATSTAGVVNFSGKFASQGAPSVSTAPWYICHDSGGK
jgi:hypothetical protein